MNKLIITIIVTVATLLAVTYFWNKGPVETPNLQYLPATTLSPEDAAVAQELQAIESIDLDSEFQDVDASLNQL